MAADDVTPAAHSAYRPAIDGLRAVAIIPVLVFHLRPDWLPGGYLGVDVFFVISGYLITSILLREMDGGTFTLRRFWARRIRRIVPALLVVTAATVFVSHIFMFPPFRRSVAEQALTTLGSCANVYLWRHAGNYWGPQAEGAPFLHMWSLSVEEQFYLVFPIFLHVVWRHARQALVAMLIALTAGGFAVFVLGLSVAPAATFYLPFGRVWELGMGACLGALPRMVRPDAGSRRSLDWLASAGLAAILISYFMLPRSSPWTAVPVAAAAFVISGSDGGPCGRLLSLPVLVRIGRLSYSLYLWHWPILVLSRLLVPGISALAIVVATVVSSWLTHVFVEEPMRRPQDRLPAVGVAYATLMGILGWMLWAPPTRYDVTAFDMPKSTLRMYSVRPRPSSAFQDVFADVEAPPTIGLPDSFAKDGIVVGEGSEPPAILVFGDSHAAVMGEALRTAAERLGHRIAFYCMTGGVISPYVEIPVRRKPPNKVLSSEEQYQFDLARLAAIEKWRPRVIVLCARWSIYHEKGTAFLEYLDQKGIKAILVEQPPELATVGDNSVIQYLCWKGVSPAPGIERLLPQGHQSRIQAVNARLREIVALHPDCAILPLYDLYARGDQALVLDGREVIYLDDDHLTTDGTLFALPRITACLAEALE